MLRSTHSRIDYYRNLRPGSHLCQFYNNSREYFDSVVPFFQVGLKANQFCLWVVANNTEQVIAYKTLNKAVPNLVDYVKKGQIEIVSRSNWYRGPVSGFPRALRGWLPQLEKRARDFETIRINGNVSWLKKKEWDDFLRYENLFDDLTSNMKVIALCSYPIKKLLPTEVIDVVQAHRCTLIKLKGKWSVMQSGVQKKADQDISDRKRAEEERKELLLQLKKKNENLEMLSRQIVSIQEKERRHIARELHDEIGQLLTGIHLKLESALLLPVERIPSVIQETDTVIEELLGRVRELSLELRPAILDDLGLLPAILWHLERFTSQTAIPVDLKHSQIQNIRFSQEVETAAYRILQEALTNVMRHAGRCKVHVKIWMIQGRLSLEIRDNGKGFNLNSISDKSVTFGLSGMQERTAILNGTFLIKSAPGKGTSISVELPLNPD